jgi:hypothetical protein
MALGLLNLVVRQWVHCGPTIERIIQEIMDLYCPLWWYSIFLENDHVHVFLLQLWHKEHLQCVEVWSSIHCLHSEEKGLYSLLSVTLHHILTLGLAFSCL